MKASPIETDEIHQYSNLTTLDTVFVKHLQSEGEALDSLLKSQLRIYMRAPTKSLNHSYVNRNDFLALISLHSF